MVTQSLNCQTEFFSEIDIRCEYIYLHVQSHRMLDLVGNFDGFKLSFFTFQRWNSKQQEAGLMYDQIRGKFWMTKG